MVAVVAWNGYGRLLVAILEILASIITCYKVYKGSGSVFAYQLMAFTFMQGISFFIMFLAIICAPTTFVDQEGVTKTYPNFYITEIGVFFWFLSQLQLWLFGVKYMESAINFSKQPLLINKKQLNKLFWGILVTFVVATIGVVTISMFLFPGYSDSSSISWLLGSQIAIFSIYSIFWLLLNGSIIWITVYSVYKIIKSFQQIQLKEPSLTLKTKPMIVHCILMLVTLAFSLGFMVDSLLKLPLGLELIFLALIPFSDLFV